MIGYEIYLTNLVLGRILITVIKPGPAWRVEPRPGRPGGWTGSGLLKDRLMQQPGKTRRINPWPGRPGQTRTRPDVYFFLFKCRFCVDLGRRRFWPKGQGMTDRGTREVVAGHICSFRDAINTSPHLTTNLRISYTRANLVPVKDDEP